MFKINTNPLTQICALEPGITIVKGIGCLVNLLHAQFINSIEFKCLTEMNNVKKMYSMLWI